MGLAPKPNRAFMVPVVAVSARKVGDELCFTDGTAELARFPRSAEVLSITSPAGVNNYEIAYQLPGGVTVAPKNLRFTTLTYSYEALTDWAFERLGEHKTGRPFGSLRGRSKGVSLSR